MVKRTVAALVAVVVVGFTAGLAMPQDDALRIAVEGAYPPFSETLPSGEIVGFDVDIARALCAELKAECEIVDQAWEGIIPGLLERKYDAIIASMSITEERKQVVDFTEKYYESPGAFVGTKDVAVEITVDGLAGKAVGVQGATVSECYVESNWGDIVDLKRYDTQENANLDLTLGRLDLVFADLFTLTDGFLNREGGDAYEVKGGSIADRACMGEGIGIAVRQDDDVLRERFNAAIRAIRASGVYQEINAKYFPFDLYGAAP